MFRSFLQAGFDCTVVRNRDGQPVDSIASTAHDARLEEDYARVRALGIRTVRDGAPWSRVRAGGSNDWTLLDRIVEAGERHGLEVIHDLCHFGYPADLDILSDRFVDDFAEFCHEFAHRLHRRGHRAPIVSPINEPSYFAWAAGHAAAFPPYWVHRAGELKIQLGRAVIAGVEAIWKVCPGARILSIDPLCSVVAPAGRPDLAEAAETFNHGAVMEMWDIIAGRLHPQLGGSRRHLGCIGINYYWTNQWELGAEDVPLRVDDPRRLPLSTLVERLWTRYGADMVIAETGHLGAARPGWVREISAQARRCIERGLPLHGVCFYPILGMPSWHAPATWLDMGLWDVGAAGERTLSAPMWHELQRALGGVLRDAAGEASWPTALNA